MKEIIAFISTFIIILVLSNILVYAVEVLEEGETKIYRSSRGYNTLKLVMVSDQTNKAVFELNNITTIINEDDRHIFDDGSEIYVRDILKNEAGDATKDIVEFFILFKSWQNTTTNKTIELKNIIINDSTLETQKNNNQSLINENKSQSSGSLIKKSKRNFFENFIMLIKKLFKIK